MSRAATNITYGSGEEQNTYSMGDHLPDDVAEELPDNLILENLAESDPDKLTRAQLLILAGLSDGESFAEPIEYNEEDLLEALSNFRTKGDVLDWFNGIRPGQTLIDTTDDQTRDEMVDAIVEELTGE